MAVLKADFSTQTPQSGLGIIDKWLVELRPADNTADIANSLERVKTQLESDQINTDEFVQILQMLAQQTVEFSTRMGSEGDIAVRLESVASALRSMAGQAGK